MKWFRSERKVTCPVLGTKLIYKTKGLSGTNGYPSENIPSIDRIDPNKGYTQDNCRIVSLKANVLLSNGTLEEIEKVYLSLKKDCSDPSTVLKNSGLCGKPETDELN